MSPGWQVSTLEKAFSYIGLDEEISRAVGMYHPEIRRHGGMKDGRRFPPPSGEAGTVATDVGGDSDQKRRLVPIDATRVVLSDDRGGEAGRLRCLPSQTRRVVLPQGAEMSEAG